MSKITNLEEWRESKKQEENESKNAFEELLKEWDELEEMYRPVSDTEEVTVHHTLVTDDRTDDEFLTLRNLLDEMGATYTVSSKPPEGNPFE